jgi:uncharacterized delta-60 repeat protein
MILVLLLTLAFPVAGAHGADWPDPSFGSGGAATPALPPEASQKQASIVDLAPTPDGAMVGALGGISDPGYFGAVRLTPAGEPDPAFGEGGFTSPLPVPRRWSGFNQEVEAEALAVQGDGKIVVVGFLKEGLDYPKTFTMLLARYQGDGSLDPSFGVGGIVLAPQQVGPGGVVLHAIALGPDGRIIVVGGRNEPRRGDKPPAGVVYAFNSDGSRDKSFGRGGQVLFSQRSRKVYSSLHDVAILDNGKIFVAGYHKYRLLLARLRPDGSSDRRFGDGDGRVVMGIHNSTCCPPAALAVQGGRVVVAANGGPFHTARVYLLRFRPNGTLDRSFGNRGVEAPYLPWRLFEVDDVAVQADGGILTVGQSAITKANPNGGKYAVFRNLPTGSPDGSFGQHGLQTFQYGDFGYAGAALAQPDGGILTGGSFWTTDSAKWPKSDEVVGGTFPGPIVTAPSCAVSIAVVLVQSRCVGWRAKNDGNVLAPLIVDAAGRTRPCRGFAEQVSAHKKGVSGVAGATNGATCPTDSSRSQPISIF